MPTDEELAEVATFAHIVMGLIADELDRRELVPKSLLARRILESADAEERAAPNAQGRIDLPMLRAFAADLLGPQPPRWTPVVIDGGLSGDPKSPDEPD